MTKFNARFACLTSALALALAMPAAAQSPKVGDPPEASNMRLVGMNDLQARSAYQPTIHKQGDRFIAYIGHHGGTPEVPKPLNPLTGQAEFNGTSIVDVTDPSKPKYLFHIPGQQGNFEAGGAQMTRVCDGSALPKGDRSAVYLLRSFGGAGHEIWNVADPSKPKYLFHSPGQEGNCEAGGAQMTRVCDGSALPKGDRNAVYLCLLYTSPSPRD